MEDFAATMGWLYEASGLEGATSAVREWLSGIDWTPLFVALAALAAIYVAYVILDESI